MMESSRVKRAIVSVATGQYLSLLARLRDQLTKQGEHLLAWTDELPPHSPSHTEIPYAFKVYALAEARRLGYQQVLWFDSSVLPLQPLDQLWEWIDGHGYWFSSNLPHGQLNVPPWTVGQWCSDAALPLLGLTREQAFRIPLVIGGAFGLDFTNYWTRDFFARLIESMPAFCGPWPNRHGEASADPRVLGHRHDQTVLSVLAWINSCKLTTPPKFIVDGAAPTEETLLEIRRL